MTAPKTTGARVAAFNAVGVVGFGVQIAALWLLVRVGQVPYLWATAIAVETAILHNFICHWCWTWSDRVAGRAEFVLRLVRFNATNGAVSLAVNVALMAFLQGVVGLHYLIANLVGVLCSSAANFILGDRVVFARGAGRNEPCRSLPEDPGDLVAVGRLERNPPP
jgi:putative flippase GtrA